MAETDPTWENWGRMKPDEDLFYEDYKKQSEILGELLARLDAEVERLRSRVAELDELSDSRRHKIKQMAAVLGGLRQENADLRAALVEERAKAEFLASKYHKDYEFFTYVWDRADGETAIQKAVALDKARAALGGDGKGEEHGRE